jgi:hypothetical protein
MEFELRYLLNFTTAGLKPLSRWEKELPWGERSEIKKRGLKVAVIPRVTLSGKKVREVIFGLKKEPLELYQRYFWGSFFKRTPEVQKLEGELFGYPKCCIESYVKRGYQENGFSREDQEILFHWACFKCQKTHRLLPLYRKVYEETLKENSFPRRNKFWLSLAAASFLFSLATSSLNEPNPHLLPVVGDTDRDGVKDDEEGYFRTNPSVFDAVKIAQGMAERIEKLPEGRNLSSEEKKKKVYRVLHRFRGLVECAICGERVNMGYIEIVNLRREKKMEVPFLALHYLKHGSFAWREKTVEIIRETWINPKELDNVLWEMDPHMKKTPEDGDFDGLTASQESYFHYSPTNPDTNRDGIMNGVRQCEVCGEVVAMGLVEIVNSEVNSPPSLWIPFHTFHYLIHGSLAYLKCFSTPLAGGKVSLRFLWEYLELSPNFNNAHNLRSWGEIKEIFKK